MECPHKPKIAVLIPCHNEELTIGKVVDDFRGQLPSAAIYVFDNCSTDASASIARGHGAVVVREPRRGKGFVVEKMFASVVRDGQQDAEFKQLLDWYIQNAKPGEKMLSTMSELMGILAPKYRDSFTPTGEIKADSPGDFVNRCYAKGITYIAWDSMMGLSPDNVYYQPMKLENIDVPRRPQSVGPYEYITTIFHKTEKRRYIKCISTACAACTLCRKSSECSCAGAGFSEQEFVCRSLRCLVESSAKETH